MRKLFILLVSAMACALSASDRSDAPSPYPGFVVYQTTGGYRLDYLGNGVTDDASPLSGWTADEEDDGVEFFNMNKGGTALIKIAVVETNSNSDLAVWMDFNDDGDWADAGERVVWAGKSPSATHGAFPARVAPPYGGSSTAFCQYNVAIPANAAGSSVKVRVLLWDVTYHSNNAMALNGGGHPGGASGYGYTDFGEVEDHDVPYGSDTGSKVRVAEYDGWGTIGADISNGGSTNVGALTAGNTHNIYFVLGNWATASCFVRFTNANPTPTIFASNIHNCSVQLFTPGNGVTLSPGTLNFATIAMVTPSSAAAFSYVMNMPTNDPQHPTYSWTVQGNGAAPAPLIEIHRPTYTVIANGSTHDYGSQNAGASFSGGYTIFNSGTAQLDFTGNPMVAISAQNNCSVNVTQPTQTYLPSGGWSMGVPMDITPTTGGSGFSFTITVSNNDPANGTYVIYCTGTAVTSGGGGGGGGSGGGSGGTPALSVTRGGVSVVSGSTDNLGFFVNGGTTIFSYTATNSGTAPLTFTGNPRVDVTNISNCAVTVTQQLPTGLAASASAPIVVSITTTGEGQLGFTLTIASDAGTYTINVSGSTGVTPPAFNSPIRKGNGRAGGGGGCAAGEGHGFALLVLALMLGVAAAVRRRVD